MNAVDIVAIEHQGDDLVITVRAALTGYDKFAITLLAIVLVGGIVASVASFPWSHAPYLPIATLMAVIGTVRVWSDLRWQISGSEEWRLAGTTLVYRQWRGDDLKLRRELDLGQIDRLGARRRPRNLAQFEFAVVIAMADRLVGRGRLPSDVAASINAALRAYLARPDILHRASAFDT